MFPVIIIAAASVVAASASQETLHGSTAMSWERQAPAWPLHHRSHRQDRRSGHRESAAPDNGRGHKCVDSDRCSPVRCEKSEPGRCAVKINRQSDVSFRADQ